MTENFRDHGQNSNPEEKQLFQKQEIILQSDMVMIQRLQFSENFSPLRRVHFLDRRRPPAAQRCCAAAWALWQPSSQRDPQLSAQIITKPQTTTQTNLHHESTHQNAPDKRSGGAGSQPICTLVIVVSSRCATTPLEQMRTPGAVPCTEVTRERDRSTREYRTVLLSPAAWACKLCLAVISRFKGGTQDCTLKPTMA